MRPTQKEIEYIRQVNQEAAEKVVRIGKKLGAVRAVKSEDFSRPPTSATAPEPPTPE